MESVAKIVNSTPFSKIKVPDTKYLIKKSIQTNFKFNLHIKCNRCANYIESTNSTAECELCSKTLKTLTSDYFVYIPIEQQLKQSVSKNMDLILEYHSTVKQEAEITDMHNCILFKNASKKYFDHIILPIVVNTDGAKVFQTGQKSLWMIQYYQCFLPPAIRYHPSNVAVIAAHFGPQKPNMKDFFLPFLKEMRAINENGGLNFMHNGKMYKFMPLLLGCCCDLPAKKCVQEMTGPTGHFGCGFCLHPGISITPPDKKKSFVRYIKGTYKYRTHDDIVGIYSQLKNKSEAIAGVQSMSCLIAAPDFDLIEGFSIDYMHCVLIGIMKKLLDLWYETKNHTQPYYINKKNQTILNNRLLKIKTIFEIVRKPRALSSRHDFKANEMRGMLFYYLWFALDGLLDRKYVAHFRLLSTSIYALSKENISSDTMLLSRLQLEEFADNFEVFYGKWNVTMNLHLLRHIPRAVEHLGPLWAQSAFAFEANNGSIVSGVTGTKDIVHQIAWKYCVQHKISPDENQKKDSLSKKEKRKITSQEKEMFEKNNFTTIDDHMTIFKSAMIKGVKYTSTLMREVSTIDYFVKIKSDKICAIKYFFVLDVNLYAVADMYEIIDKHQHFFEIERSETQEIFRATQDIQEKCIFLKFGFRQFVTFKPNKYEKT